LFRIARARYVYGRDVGAHDFQDGRLNVIVGDPLNVAVSAFLVPYLKRLTANAVEDGQKTALKRVLEHAQKNPRWVARETLRSDVTSCKSEELPCKLGTISGSASE